MPNHKFTNALIHETSPYLLQHAHNPVNWFPWNDDTLKKAQLENKPILVSIGYSACHWCHVMEHESFEDESVAALMNAHFVCIKVDREERPDIDHIYMDALQLMTGGGGWPLNCFALPDGRPFFGGTYFKKEQWKQVLHQINRAFDNDLSKLAEYAEKLTEGLHQMDQIPVKPINNFFDSEVVETAIMRWKKEFDWKEGGPKRAPKFPIPNNYQFLLAFAFEQDDAEIRDFVNLTLTKMCRGGIYDQIGGGFSRYSVDDLWKVPHFEKMLYDNGQLLSLYSQAFLAFRIEEFREILESTANFILNEMQDESGAFYSAIDADSEGEEGKFYIWKREEILELAGKDFNLISQYYNVNLQGHWEHGNYILLRDGSDAEIANSFEIKIETLKQKVEIFKQKAFEKRALRIRPGLDDKCLTSWNAIAAKGLAEASISSGNPTYLNAAIRNLDFIWKKQRQAEGKLWHSYKNGVSSIEGYLEDYAHTIDAQLKVYEATFDEKWILQAKSTFEFVLNHFEQNDGGFFYFKSKTDPALIAKKAEINDNVMPASNSIIATCAFKLGLLFGKSDWIEIAQRMLTQVESSFIRYPSGYSQWMLLHQYFSEPFYEVAIVGLEALAFKKQLQAQYLPNVIFCGSETDSNLEVLKGKYQPGKTLIYVCQNGACLKPNMSVEEALDLLL